MCLLRFRTLARIEAELLFREQAMAGSKIKSPLPDVSMKVSAAINIPQDTLVYKFRRQRLINDAENETVDIHMLILTVNG